MTLTEQAAELFGLELTDTQAAQFATYARELVAWNEQVNLTAITTPDGIQTRHFLDSLSLTQGVTLRAGMTLIDVGTGAGFPGLPLAILMPGVQVTLLESTRKKINFLQHVIEALKLPNAVTLNARAEDAGQMSLHREQYDVVVARAVARLPALLEYLLPLAKRGGWCAAMKGSTAHIEATDSAAALRTLGGRLDRIETVTLPGVDDPHYLVLVEKVAPTPAPYPRKPGIPTKKPL